MSAKDDILKRIEWLTGEPPGELAETVVAAVAEALDEVTRDLLRTLPEVVAEWNAAPIERRREIVALLMDAPVPGDEVEDIEFVAKAGDGVYAYGIDVNMRMRPSIDMVHITISRGQLSD